MRLLEPKPTKMPKYKLSQTHGNQKGEKGDTSNELPQRQARSQKGKHMFQRRAQNSQI